MGVGLLSQEIQRSCEGSQESSVLGYEGRFEAQNAPESQTLIVLSFDPDTILVPSGENAAERMKSLWALVFSVLRSSVAARQASRHQFWPRSGDLRPKMHLNPKL